MVQIKRKLPFPLLLSGVLQSFLFNIVVGIVGLCFLVFGFVADWIVLTIVGALAIAFYILISVRNPIRTLSKLSEEAGETEFDKTVDAVLHGEKKPGLSLYKRAVFALEDTIRQRDPDWKE